MIGLWAAVATAGIWDSALVPTPRAVGESLWRGLSDGALSSAIAVSLRRVITGYALSLAIGVPLGMLLARRKGLDETIGTLVTGQQSLPSICWLPLALLGFGMGDHAILFVVVMGSLASITVVVRDGVRNVPPDYVRAARTLGARGLALYREVLLPASLPTILTAAKLGWAFAWRALMAGELLVASAGLGRLLMMGRERADMELVLAVLLVVLVIGVFIDRAVFGALERRVRARWGLARA